MTITIETMPRKFPRRFAEVDRPDAPTWATRATTYCSGSMDTPAGDGDLRTWERPIGHFEWDNRSEFYERGAFDVIIEQREVAEGSAVKSAGPAVAFELSLDGLDFTRPEDMRAFASLVLKAADELEQIQGAAPAAFDQSSDIDTAIEATVVRIAREQGKPVPTMRRSRSGSVYIESVGEAARSLGMKSSELLEAAGF